MWAPESARPRIRRVCDEGVNGKLKSDEFDDLGEGAKRRRLYAIVCVRAGGLFRMTTRLRLRGWGRCALTPASLRMTIQKKSMTCGPIHLGRRTLRLRSGQASRGGCPAWTAVLSADDTASLALGRDGSFDSAQEKASASVPTEHYRHSKGGSAG